MAHVQCLQTYPLFIVTFLKFLCMSHVYSIECKRSNRCACHLTSFTGGTIDLSSLASRKGNPKFQGSDSFDPHVQIQFNPCYGFTNVNSNGICDDVAVCKIQTNHTETNYECLGREDSMQFLYNESISEVYLQFQGGSITTQVILKCNPSKHSLLQDLHFVNSSLYQMTLESPCACPNGCLYRLSIGSILCIVFSSIVLVYFTVGMLYRRTVYELKGWQAVPNHEFWLDLPSLIKDGYLFFISPCLGNRVEYRRYERL